MKLLILGGTRFCGRFTTQYALQRNHDVTLFHRGQSNPDLFPNARHIHGDRNVDIHTIPEESWDAVIDFCAYLPDHIHTLFDRIQNRTKHYVLISTISVYDVPDGAETIHEHSPLHTTTHLETPHTLKPQTYGPLKVLCEEATRERSPNNTTIIRPGLIAGPHDASDRFTWWPARIQRSGTIPTPSPPTSPVQFIDARDLALWIIHCVEHEIHGTFNAVGPDQPTTLQNVLDACVSTIQPDPRPTWRWIDDAFLKQHSETWTPFHHIPLWVPPSSQAICRVDASAARSNGLTNRPIHETIQDTLTWWRSTQKQDLRAGLSEEQEAELLRTYDTYLKNKKANT